MRKSYFVISFIAFVLIFILHPLNLFGQETKQEMVSKVDINNNLISAELKDADLPEVLKEIEKGTGVKISIVKEFEGKKVTASFKDLDAESALRKLLGNNYVFVFTKDTAKKDKYVLKEVMTANDAFGSKISKGKMITKEIAYGNGKEEVGAMRGGEGANMGPKSFAVDDKGNIYICDTVNGRVQVFSSDGSYLFTISLKGHAVYEDKGRRVYSNLIEDIAVDKYGFVYIYDDLRKLYQYDKNGNIVTSIDVDKGHHWKTSGNLHIVNDNIYIDTCASDMCGYFLEGKIIDGLFTPPTNAEQKQLIEKGAYGLSGKRYLFGTTDSNEGEIDIINTSGTTKKISFPLKKDALLTRFLGEDEKGNLFIESQRYEDGKHAVEVHKLNANGDYLGSTLTPESDVFFVPNKEYSVSKEGTVYQFQPEKDKLRINIFPIENE